MRESISMYGGSHIHFVMSQCNRHPLYLFFILPIYSSCINLLHNKLYGAEKIRNLLIGKKNKNILNCIFRPFQLNETKNHTIHVHQSNIVLYAHVQDIF